MPARAKITAVAALVLAAGFYWFFFFDKHDPELAPLAPFGNDPYDASGSFCMIVSVLLGILSVVRAFRGYKENAARTGRVYVARTQAAVATGILVTLYIDGIAMARHPSQWLGKPGAGELVELMGGMAAAALGVAALARWAAADSAAGRAKAKWPSALTAMLIAGVAMAIFPERAIQFVGWHFMAILLGFALVAWPQAWVARAIVPCNAFEQAPFRRPWLPWLLIGLFGAAIGVSALAVEMSEGGAGSMTQRMVMAGMFLGAGAGTMMIGYVFLGRTLALFRKLTVMEKQATQTIE